MDAALNDSDGSYGRVPELKGSVDLLRRTCESDCGRLCLNPYLWLARLKPDTHNFPYVCGETWQVWRQD